MTDCGRFYLAWDMNLDGVVTISDFWEMLRFLVLLPAKIITEVLASSPSAAAFFEIDCSTGGGLGAGVFSAIVFWFAYTFVMVKIDDRSITRSSR